MTHEKAWEIAAQWGVCVTGGEKGSVFYSLTGKANQIVDEDHRQQLLSYTDDCLLVAKSRVRDVAYGELDEAKQAYADLVALRVYFERTPTADAAEQFLNGYLEAALWLLPEPEEDDDYEPNSFSYADLPDDVIEKARKDCDRFQADNAENLAAVYQFPIPATSTPESHAGHNFWLSRNGHGSGFWDRGYPKALAEALHEASKKFPEVNLSHSDGTFYYE